jgi:hypothetical protein
LESEHEQEPDYGTQSSGTIFEKDQLVWDCELRTMSWWKCYARLQAQVQIFSRNRSHSSAKRSSNAVMSARVIILARPTSAEGGLATVQSSSNMFHLDWWPARLWSRLVTVLDIGRL